MNSLRYLVFNKSLRCISCNISGDFFLLQSHQGTKSKTNCFIENCHLCFYKENHREERLVTNQQPHFNLYHIGKRGGLVLMTKDHFLPKSKGGSDDLDNLNTMCRLCNSFKGNSLPGEFSTIYKDGNVIRIKLSPRSPITGNDSSLSL